MSDNSSLEERFATVLREVERRCQVGEAFLDKDVYRLYLASLWANAVLDPARTGLETEELESFYDFLNDRGRTVLGSDEPVLDSFRYLLGREGEQAMDRLRVPAGHRRQLLRFGELMGLSSPAGIGS